MTTAVMIARNSLLMALVDEDRRRLRPHLEAVRLPRGVLLEAGQRVTHVHFPLDCVISLAVPMGDGGTVETATIGREGMDGYVVALGNHRTLLRSVVQIEGEAARLPVCRLEEAFAASAAVRDLVLRYAQVVLGHVAQVAACNAVHATEARFCRCLLLLRDRFGGNTLSFTHEALAEMLGVQRPTVTLVARTLQAAGLIRYRRGVVEILDGEGLEEAGCECYGAILANYEAVLPGRFASLA